MFRSRPVHSLMLSSHHFPCLPLHLTPWSVPCRTVLASPDDRVMCPYHFSLRLFTEVMRSSYGPVAFPVLAFTSSLVMRSHMQKSHQDGEPQKSSWEGRRRRTYAPGLVAGSCCESRLANPYTAVSCSVSNLNARRLEVVPRAFVFLLWRETDRQTDR